MDFQLSSIRFTEPLDLTSTIICPFPPLLTNGLTRYLKIHQEFELTKGFTARLIQNKRKSLRVSPLLARLNATIKETDALKLKSKSCFLRQHI